jgi:hypothetical protein
VCVLEAEVAVAVRAALEARPDPPNPMPRGVTDGTDGADGLTEDLIDAAADALARLLSRRYPGAAVSVVLRRREVSEPRVTGPIAPAEAERVSREVGDRLGVLLHEAAGLAVATADDFRKEHQ